MKTPIFCLLPLCLLACSEPAVQNTASAPTPAPAVATANAAQSKRSRQAIKHAGTHAYYPNRYMAKFIRTSHHIKKTSARSVAPCFAWTSQCYMMNMCASWISFLANWMMLTSQHWKLLYASAIWWANEEEIVPPELLPSKAIQAATGLQYADAGEGMAMITIVPDYMLPCLANSFRLIITLMLPFKPNIINKPVSKMAV